jgi:hypothetical protein
MWHRGVINIALVLAIGVIAGYGLLAVVYLPLEQGSSSGPDTNVPGSRYLRTESDPFGSGSLYVYCGKPAGDFAWMVSLRNDGPVTITLLGLGDGPLALADQVLEDGFGIHDLAPYRAAEPTDTPLTSHDARDPRKAPALRPVEIAPGDEFEVWVRWSTGSTLLAEGSLLTSRSIPVRYRILGVERSAQVPLRDGVGVEAPCRKG